MQSDAAIVTGQRLSLKSDQYSETCGRRIHSALLPSKPCMQTCTQRPLLCSKLSNWRKRSRLQFHRINDGNSIQSILHVYTQSRNMEHGCKINPREKAYIYNFTGESIRFHPSSIRTQGSADRCRLQGGLPYGVSRTRLSTHLSSL